VIYHVRFWREQIARAAEEWQRGRWRVLAMAAAACAISGWLFFRANVLPGRQAAASAQATPVGRSHAPVSPGSGNSPRGVAHTRDPQQNMKRHATVVVLVVANLLIAGGGQNAAEPGGLPRVLLIGDHGWGPKSPPGATGYMEHVARRLEGRAVVVRSPDSGATTAKALTTIPGNPSADATRLDVWLGSEPWDVIHVSFGLHDAKLDDEGRPAVSLDEFSRNLERILDRLEQTGARLVWASATPVAKSHSRRRAEDIVRFNEVAREIVERRGIPVNDLHAAAAGQLDAWLVPGSPHLNATGAAAIAAEVAASVEAALGR